MYPDRKEAERLLAEAETHNPGAWYSHSRICAFCAGKIAEKSGLDSDKAYVLGLLHDIGRRFSKGHLRHVYDGYMYMTELGYDEAARVCLSHSFNRGKLEDYIGNLDTDEEETAFLKEKLEQMVFDDYDLLIQLCDAIAGSETIMDMEERMEDVRSRYGSYSQEKRERNLALKAYFEEKMREDLYEAVGKDSFRIEDMDRP